MVGSVKLFLRLSYIHSRRLLIILPAHNLTPLVTVFAPLFTLVLPLVFNLINCFSVSYFTFASDNKLYVFSIPVRRTRAPAWDGIVITKGETSIYLLHKCAYYEDIEIVLYSTPTNFSCDISNSNICVSYLSSLYYIFICRARTLRKIVSRIYNISSKLKYSLFKKILTNNE